MLVLYWVLSAITRNRRHEKEREALILLVFVDR